MGMRIGYGKIGRSMPLTLEKCANLGGDVEMVAVVKELALRHPDDTFILVGRNSGENPVDVGMPPNVHNPWTRWQPQLREWMKAAELRSPLSFTDHLRLREIYQTLTEPTIKGLDGIVMWVGQHGSSNSPIPTVKDRDVLTKPQDAYAYYASFLLEGINRWRDQDPYTLEEIYLNADARNYLKMRDLKWPLQHPVLTQYNFKHNIKHERYGDPGGFHHWKHVNAKPIWQDTPQGDVASTWQTQVTNVYSRLEINGLAPGTPFGDLISFNDDHDRAGDFGLFINEARAAGIHERRRRLTFMNDWVMPMDPYFVHGTWSDASQQTLMQAWGLEEPIKPAPWDQYYPRLHSVRCTFTTPSSGSGWATAKPWEAFAGGTVCFFHPGYDDQDNILGDAPDELRYFLRVKTPHELSDRIREMRVNREAWLWMIHAQRAHFNRAMQEKTYMKMIEERLYG